MLIQPLSSFRRDIIVSTARWLEYYPLRHSKTAWRGTVRKGKIEINFHGHGQRRIGSVQQKRKMSKARGNPDLIIIFSDPHREAPIYLDIICPWLMSKFIPTSELREAPHDWRWKVGGCCRENLASSNKGFEWLFGNVKTERVPTEYHVIHELLYCGYDNRQECCRKETADSVIKLLCFDSPENCGLI